MKADASAAELLRVLKDRLGSGTFADNGARHDKAQASGFLSEVPRIDLRPRPLHSAAQTLCPAVSACLASRLSVSKREFGGEGEYGGAR